MFKTSKKYGGYERHPLYVELYKLHAKNVANPAINYDVEHPGCSEFGKIPPNMSPAIYNSGKKEPDQKPPVTAPAAVPAPVAPVATVLPVESQPATAAKQSPAAESKEKPHSEPGDDVLARKKQKRCDEILAEYLDSVAKYVNKECYKQVLKFAFLFRECLNRYGDRLRGTAPISAAVKTEAETQGEYCLTSNAEQAPDISNEFVTVYLDELKPSFGKMSAIELTQNFCGWLFNNAYTSSKLSLIQENNPE